MPRSATLARRPLVFALAAVVALLAAVVTSASPAGAQRRFTATARGSATVIRTASVAVLRSATASATAGRSPRITRTATARARSSASAAARRHAVAHATRSAATPAAARRAARRAAHAIAHRFAASRARAAARRAATDLAGRRAAQRAHVAAASAAGAKARSAANSAVSTPSPTPNSACGGEQPTGGWTCSFDDEFDGTSLDRNTWLVQTTAASGWHGGNACAVDDPSTVSVSDGHLNLTARDTGQDFTCQNPDGDFRTRYAEGSVTTNQGFGQAYGLWKIRAKFPDSTTAGLQSALWLWPQDVGKYGNGVYPYSGEIDIAENYSKYSNLAVPYIHYAQAGDDPNVTAFDCTLDRGAFNTYSLLWTKSTLTISVNDRTCLVDQWNPMGMTRPAPFDSPFMILLTQELGVGENALDPNDPPSLPATTQVDYVRVWKSVTGG